MAQVTDRPHNAPPPPDVDLVVKDGWARVSARAGSPGWQPILGLAVSFVWAAPWGIGLAGEIGSMLREVEVNQGPTLFIYSLGTLSGIYCAGLCLWTMFGHERLVIGTKRLSISNPWLFGLRAGSFELGRLQPFRCSGEGCGVTPDGHGCCCRWSANEYEMSFGYRGQRVSVFPQLPPASKDWLRDRLNQLLVARCAEGLT